MLRDLFKRSQDSPSAVQRVTDLEAEVLRLNGLVKQLRRDHDELDEATARRFKRIAARNAAPEVGQSEGPSTDGPVPQYRMTWRERIARRRNGNAEVQNSGG
jgi:hypothetical protein